MRKKGLTAVSALCACVHDCLYRVFAALICAASNLQGVASLRPTCRAVAVHDAAGARRIQGVLCELSTCARVRVSAADICIAGATPRRWYVWGRSSALWETLLEGGLATMLVALVATMLCWRNLLELWRPFLSHGVGVEITRVGSIYGGWTTRRGGSGKVLVWFPRCGTMVLVLPSQATAAQAFLRSSLGGLLDGMATTPRDASDIMGRR